MVLKVLKLGLEDAPVSTSSRIPPKASTTKVVP